MVPEPVGISSSPHTISATISSHSDEGDQFSGEQRDNGESGSKSVFGSDSEGRHSELVKIRGAKKVVYTWYVRHIP